jgi:rhodanese-related sulfurtransferase
VTVLLGAGGAAAGPRIETAVKPEDVPAHKRSVGELYVTATEAYAAVRREPGILLIDIRTHGETVFAGVATPMHRHVPYMMLEDDHGYDADRRRYKLSPSPDFAKAIEQLFAEYKLERSATVILYCSTGERSAKAAGYLAQIGYGAVYTMVDGFDGDAAESGRLGRGWKPSGLPWTLELSPAQAYKSPSM